MGSLELEPVDEILEILVIVGSVVRPSELEIVLLPPNNPPGAANSGCPHLSGIRAVDSPSVQAQR